MDWASVFKSKRGKNPIYAPEFILKNNKPLNRQFEKRKLLGFFCIAHSKIPTCVLYPYSSSVGSSRKRTAASVRVSLSPVLFWALSGVCVCVWSLLPFFPVSACVICVHSSSSSSSSFSPRVSPKLSSPTLPFPPFSLCVSWVFFYQGWSEFLRKKDTKKQGSFFKQKVEMLVNMAENLKF